MRTYVRTLPNFTTAVQSGTRAHKSRTHNYVSTSAGEWSGHGRTSRTSSGAYVTVTEAWLSADVLCTYIFFY